jgi:hypothetical protein
VGDKCRPKYFEVQKLNVQLGEKREVSFYWQESYEQYHSVCLTNGLFYISNSEQLAWVSLNRNKAVIFPPMNNIYSSLAYLSMNYGSQTKLLKFSTFTLYEILVPATNPKYPLMMSKFAEISDVWFPAMSTFKFRDNLFDS